jgi:23S rRNA (adenine2503-C2)-methyltransferase
VPATVRVRRGIDIDAGCGQLKSEVMRRQRAATEATGTTAATPTA